MKKIAILLIVLMVFSVGFLSGCQDSNNPLNPPEFVIMSQSKREAYEGANRVGYVDVTIKNNGGSGSKTIYVQVTQGSNYWTEEQTIQLDSEESTSLSFRFPQIEFWTTNSWDFGVSVG
jgi:hypothetical protein